MPSRILVVDDEGGIRNLLHAILTQEGYDVSVAGDGYTALRMLQKQRIDVLFLDLIMPMPDGFEILNYLRKRNKRPILIIISGMVSDEFMQDLSKVYPIFTYLHKPFTVDEVKQLLNTLKLQKRNMSIIKKMLDWKTWLKGLMAAAISGAANSVVAMFVAPETFNYHQIGKLLSLAVGSGLVGAFMYLKQSPIPTEVDVPIDTVETTVKTIVNTPSKVEIPKKENNEDK